MEKMYSDDIIKGLVKSSDDILYPIYVKIIGDDVMICDIKNIYDFNPSGFKIGLGMFIKNDDNDRRDLWDDVRNLFITRKVINDEDGVIYLFETPSIDNDSKEIFKIIDKWFYTLKDHITDISKKNKLERMNDNG